MTTPATLKPARRVGPWNLTDLAQIEKNGLKVFSCFCCGGGSTMGYKLAGFTVLGGVEIDPEMMRIYRENHNPAHAFQMSVQHFATLPREEIPDELFELDILDGSPPCSVFSMAGARQRKWGVATHFREGDEVQRLDDLFFHFISIADKLRPKVVVAENVKGLMIGRARGYVSEIFQAFNQAGYTAQLFLVNGARMGIPQARERTFFIARRKDLDLPAMSLSFNEALIGVGKAFEGLPHEEGKPLTGQLAKLWPRTPPGKRLCDAHPKGALYSYRKLDPALPAQTLAASCGLMRWDIPRIISEAEAIRLQTFPDDYNSLGVDMRYVCGMSVPPYMMQRIALEIGAQVFNRPYDPEIRTP